MDPRFLFISILAGALRFYAFVLIARALISWFRPDPYNPLVRTLYNVTEPVLEPVRRIIPPLGGLDLSILIVLIGLQLLSGFLFSLA